MRKIFFLGTGHGMPVRSSCTAILLEDEKNNILFDAGGGHDVLNRFHDAGKDPSTVENIFLTHYDSDHILGLVPIMRAWHRWAEPKKRMIFCSIEVKKAIDSLFVYVAKKHYDPVKENINFVILEDRLEYTLNGWKICFFDIKSPGSSPQFGCKILFPDKASLAFLGDEPLREHYLDIVKDSTVMIHEAFCLDGQETEFNAHQKNHSTAKEAAENASRAGVKNLLFYHMEDRTIGTRKVEYTKEARQYFKGEVFVPIDGDVYEF